MAVKLAVFALALFFLVSAKVSSNADEPLDEVAVVSPPVTTHAPAPAPGAHMIVDTKECGEVCKGRCKLHSRQNVCNRACNTCCWVCKCVPPGTYGNRELCGTCYTNWLTHGNRTKCP